MPLYEYYCADCKSRFETLTSFANSQKTQVCARCGGANARKALSLVARPARSGAGVSDYGDYEASGEAGDASGGCCGGACGCHQHN